MFKKEYLCAGLIGLVVLVLSNLYIFSGMIFPKEGMVFMGRHVINEQDTYTYVAFLEQAKQGEVLFENLYTSDPQDRTLLRPSYLVLGNLARVLDISSIAAYHLGRVIFSVVFFCVLYYFLGYFFHTAKRRLLAFTVVLTSTGLGFLLGAFWPQSSDLWIPESITFLSLQEAPHFSLSQTLMLLSFIFLLKGWVTKTKKYFVFSAIPLLFLGFEHPYNLFVSMFTIVFLGVYLCSTKRISRNLAVLGIGSTLVGSVLGNLYQIYELWRNPIFRSWAFPSDSPIPRDYIVGFGCILVFAALGLEAFLRQKKTPQLLILAWFASSSILLYAPVYFQRRMSEGIHIPLAILAAEGIIITSVFLSRLMLQKAQKAALYSLAILFVIVLSIGIFRNVQRDITTIASDQQNTYFYHLLTQEVEAMQYISNNSQRDDVILTNWFYGNMLPGVTGRKVYIGHKAQTNQFDQKVEAVNKFLLNENTQAAYKFLKDNNIKYVYIGKNDSLLRYGFKPQQKPYLKKVFDQGEAKVYKVK